VLLDLGNAKTTHSIVSSLAAVFFSFLKTTTDLFVLSLKKKTEV
jgi:hypothetical protein